jgi:hypothetical protein
LAKNRTPRKRIILIMHSFRQRYSSKKQKVKPMTVVEPLKFPKVIFFSCLRDNFCGCYIILFLFFSGRLKSKTNKASSTASKPSSATIGNSTTKG